jgi:hypothetical protein
MQAQLKQYAGASSISSADYFGDGASADPAARGGGGGSNADEFMSRLSLQVRQEMSQAKNIASDVGKRLGTFMQSLNNH